MAASPSYTAFFYGTLLHPSILRRVIGHHGAELEICPALLLVSVPPKLRCESLATNTQHCTGSHSPQNPSSASISFELTSALITDRLTACRLPGRDTLFQDAAAPRHNGSQQGSHPRGSHSPRNACPRAHREGCAFARYVRGRRKYPQISNSTSQAHSQGHAAAGIRPKRCFSAPACTVHVAFLVLCGCSDSTNHPTSSDSRNYGQPVYYTPSH